jgi:S1-C subfamily serine protease
MTTSSPGHSGCESSSRLPTIANSTRNVAIGNALALPGGPTVTAGVVSALGRDVEQPGWSGQPAIVLYDMVQTDAAINPGNSGGPLVNLRGQVVGVNTLGSAEAQNINFAVSLNTTKSIVAQLRQSGRMTRGYLGGSLRAMSSLASVMPRCGPRWISSGR